MRDMGGAAGKLAGMDRRGGYEEPTTNERRRRDVASPRRQSEPASRLELETINNRRYDRGSAVTRIISGQISRSNEQFQYSNQYSSPSCRSELLGVQEPRHAKHFDYAGPRSIGLVVIKFPLVSSSGSRV
ncbi:unnamed protein product [Ascophyllum nodosum]